MTTMLTAPLSVAQAEALAENDWVLLTDGCMFCVREVLEDGSYGGDIYCSGEAEIPSSWEWHTVPQFTGAKPSAATRRARGGTSESIELNLARVRGWTTSMQNRIGLPVSVSWVPMEKVYGFEVMPRLDDRLDRIAAEIEQIVAEGAARGASEVLVKIGADGHVILPCGGSGWA